MLRERKGCEILCRSLPAKATSNNNSTARNMTSEHVEIVLHGEASFRSVSLIILSQQSLRCAAEVIQWVQDYASFAIVC